MSKEKQIQQFCHESPCICFNLKKASRAITQVYDDLFREVGLRATQISILNSAYHCGPLTVSELSQSLATDRTTLTRNLKPLERDGFIDIQCGQDRRVKEIVLTKKGLRSVQMAGEHWQKFQTKIMNKVGKERLKQLVNDLSSIVDTIQDI